MLYWRQQLSEHEVAFEDLEVLEALAPDDHSISLLDWEMWFSPTSSSKWGKEILKF